MFVPIPDAEWPKVRKAIDEGRCISCFKEFDDEGFYCEDCDDI